MAWYDTGEGTPWGAPKFGMPSRPDLISNPWDVQGLDQSPLRRAMMQRLAQSTGNMQQSGQAALSKAGIYDSSQQGALARDIADKSSQNQAGMEAGLQQQDYQNRLGLMDQINNQRLGMYGIDTGNYNAEQNARNNFWGNTIGTAANLAGMYASGGLSGLGMGGSKIYQMGSRGY